MEKVHSESLAITFHCMLLMQAKQKAIKFGVFDACRKNAILRAEISKEYQSIIDLAKEKKANEEEIKQSIEAMDKSYANRIVTIDKALVRDIEPELISFSLSGKEEFVEIFEVLSYLSHKEIIK